MFEWDEAKRLKNLAVHELDFLDAQTLFDGRAISTASSKYLYEPRMVTSGLFQGKSCTVI